MARMRKVVVYELLSLDGVAQDPDEFFGWDETLDLHLEQVIASQDAVVLGRRSYQEWAGYWPTSDLEPFASFINGVQKYVATSSALTADWSNCTVIDSELTSFVRDLKTREGGDIGVHASISVAQALLAAGVVDELRLVINPTVVGPGKRRLFDSVPRTELEVLLSQASPSGALIVHYRPRP